MKVLKSMGKIVAIYIVARVLIAIFMPDDWVEMNYAANALLIVAMLISVVSLLLGGKFVFSRLLTRLFRNVINLFRNR